MDDLLRLAAWAAEALTEADNTIYQSCGCIPGGSQDTWTPEGVLEAARIKGEDAQRRIAECEIGY